VPGQYGREGEGGRDIAAHTANREREHGGGRERGGGTSPPPPLLLFSLPLTLLYSPPPTLRGGGTSLFLLPCGPAETARPQSVRGWGREARVYSRDMGRGNSREGGVVKSLTARIATS